MYWYVWKLDAKLQKESAICKCLAFFFNMIIRIYGKGGLNVEEVGGLKAQ
jgi:hypothetical protein